MRCRWHDHLGAESRQRRPRLQHNPRGSHIVMRHGPHELIVYRVHQNAPFLSAPPKYRAAASIPQADRRSRCSSQQAAPRRHRSAAAPLGDQLRIRMIHLLRQRGDSSSATNPAAARTPTCRIAPPNRFRSSRPLSISFFGPATIDPAGAPEGFRQAEHDCVDLGRDFAYRFSGRSRRVEDTRAIHMHRHVKLMRSGSQDVIDHFLRINAPACHVVRILDFNRAGSR